MIIKLYDKGDGSEHALRGEVELAFGNYDYSCIHKFIAYGRTEDEIKRILVKSMLDTVKAINDSKFSDNVEIEPVDYLNRTL